MKPKSERKAGRPLNTGRHQAHDAIRLLQIADMKLEQPHQPLSSIIKGMIDSRDTGGVRRLQRAYKVQGNTLLAAARERHQQRQMQETVEKVVTFARSVDSVMQATAARLDAWVRSPEGQKLLEGCKRFEQALNSPEARRTITALSSHRPLRLSA